MRYALVGLGRMGEAIEIEAQLRGHVKVGEFDPKLDGSSSKQTLDLSALGDAEVAFEFTEPSAAEQNVMSLLQAGMTVVCGTTGWEPTKKLDAALEVSGGAAIIAPNFSVGMLLFSRLVREAAEQLGATGLHRPWILEAHHTGKKDSPSGTARHLADLIMTVDPRIRSVQEGNSEGCLPEDALQIVSLRSGSEPGTHTVGFDGEYDRITLSHRARSRAGFAIGAVLAAEWLVGKSGLRRFEEAVDALAARGED